MQSASCCFAASLSAAYRLLARYRYSLFGKAAVCMQPNAEIQARFLNADLIEQNLPDAIQSNIP